jgi:RTX calcium-binding nonapeptide repeat (4 copies)
MSLPSRRTRIALLAGVATLGVAGTANAAVTSSYDTNTKVLSVTVDGGDTGTVVCDSGQIKVNGADPARTPVNGGPTGCANPTELIANAVAGDNTIDLRGVTRASFTALAKSTVNGGAGKDTIFGTEFADTIDPGDLDDTVNANDGNDTMIWNPGDDTDVMNGGDGVDTVIDVGGGGDEAFEIKPNGDRVSAARVNPAPFNLDIGGTEKLTVQGNGGNDTITGAVGLADLIKLTITGGDGNDAVTGGDGNDVVAGDAGNDTVLGARGNDDMAGGDGDDLLVWNPGEGTDKFEGGAGNDIAQDNGGAAAEHFVVSANGQRVTATRDNGAPFFLDIGTSETLDLNAAGGDDSVDVNNGLGALIKVDANLGDGNDSIRARNDSAQVIDGAAGTDTAQVDATDQVVNVENLDASADTAKPKAKVLSAKLKIKKGKAKVRLSLPAGESASKGSIRILRGKALYGSKKITLGPGKKTFTVAITKPARAKVAKAPGKKLKVTVKVKLTDAAGNTATASKKLNLKG